MERYAGFAKAEINVVAASIERSVSPLYHHGRSWMVTRNPLAFVSSWGKYAKENPGTSLTDYFVMQFMGNVSTDWAPWYKLLKQTQIDFRDWKRRHHAPPSREAQMKYLTNHIVRVFGTVAKKIQDKKMSRGRAKVRFDGRFLNNGGT